MLSAFSWYNFIVFLIIANLLYYSFIWIVFYKAKLPAIFDFNSRNTFSFQQQEETEEWQPTMQDIMEELHAVFHRRLNKNELTLALQLKLKRYKQWDEPAFRETINAFIAMKSESICSIHLSEEDQRVLWI